MSSTAIPGRTRETAYARGQGLGIRPPGRDQGARAPGVSTHSTMVGSLSDVANRLVGLGIEPVAMEATRDYVRHEGA